MRNKKVSIVFVVVALMLFVSVIGNAGDLDQAAVVIGITWAIGDLIYNVFGANINPGFLIN